MHSKNSSMDIDLISDVITDQLVFTVVSYHFIKTMSSKNTHCLLDVRIQTLNDSFLLSNLKRHRDRDFKTTVTASLSHFWQQLQEMGSHGSEHNFSLHDTVSISHEFEWTMT